MKKIMGLILCALLGLPLLAQQYGKVFDNKVFHSEVLGRTVDYSIYLPPDYDYSSRKYPVLYLFHGYSDDHTGWIKYGEMNRIVDELIQAGKITPLIIVVADAKQSWYINSFDGKERYEDMYIQEFIPYIEKSYRAIGAKLGRAIGGLSMGGYGSLLYSMKYTDLFYVCVAMSPAIFTDEELKDRPYGTAERYGMRDGVPNDFWRANSILDLARDLPETEKNAVHWYIDCGDDDFLYKGNLALHRIMRDLSIAHEYRARDGGHDWTYWRQCLHDGLIYIHQCMRH